MKRASASSNSRSRAARQPPKDARKTPQQARSRATVDAILDGAVQVLVRTGYHRATTSMVAKVAGVSVGSLYQYFPNKDSVFTAVRQRALDGAIESTRRALASAPGDFAARTEASIVALLEYKAKNPALHRALKTELGRLDGLRISRKREQRSRELTEQLLRAHQAELGLSDPVRAAFFVVNAVEGVIAATLLEAPQTLGEPALAQGMTRMVLSMLEGFRERPPRSRATSRHIAGAQ